MSFIETIVATHGPGLDEIAIERIAIILGITTLSMALMTFLSCRTCFSWLNRIGLKNLLRNRGYQRFYRYHAYYWWLLGVFLLSHLMLAVIHTGLPSPDDPDRVLQWITLFIGGINLGLVLTLFSSCRLYPRILDLVKPELSASHPGFRRFFQRHGLYWGVFILFIAGHVAAGYLHAGIWPQ